MPNEKQTLKGLKRKIKSFWNDEKGGEGLTTILYFAITLLIIAIILYFAMSYFNAAVDQFNSMWSKLF